MSNTRKHPSILDKDNNCDKDNWLLSIIYKDEFGPLLLIEGATNKGTKKESVHYGELVGKGQTWKLSEASPNEFDLENAYYMSFPLSEEKVTGLMEIIDEKTSKNDFEIDYSSDEENSEKKDLLSSITLFKNNELKYEKQRERMYIDFYKSISKEFNYIVDSDITFPSGLKGFKMKAEKVEVTPSSTHKI